MARHNIRRIKRKRVKSRTKRKNRYRLSNHEIRKRVYIKKYENNIRYENAKFWLNEKLKEFNKMTSSNICDRPNMINLIFSYLDKDNWISLELYTLYLRKCRKYPKPY